MADSLLSGYRGGIREQFQKRGLAGRHQTKIVWLLERLVQSRRQRRRSIRRHGRPIIVDQWS